MSFEWLASKHFPRYSKFSCLHAWPSTYSRPKSKSVFLTNLVPVPLQSGQTFFANAETLVGLSTFSASFICCQAPQISEGSSEKVVVRVRRTLTKTSASLYSGTTSCKIVVQSATIRSNSSSPGWACFPAKYLVNCSFTSAS